MKIQVLDFGYVEFVEAWGNGRGGPELSIEYDGGDPVPFAENDFEVGIIEAARQSTQGSFRGWQPWGDQPGDERLLSFLYKNHHATPFEFAGLVIEVQAPIFVFREWHRHRTQSYNEMSARYAPLPDLYYVPTLERVRSGALNTTNKQAQGSGTLHEGDVRTFVEDELVDLYSLAEKVYQKALADGIPKELARLVMPVGHYSRMRASANLRCWLSFLTLRMDTRAQWEIRQFADAVYQVVEKTFPHTAKLFKEEFEHGR
jgi:thymidylate synthase (FAD)